MARVYTRKAAQKKLAASGAAKLGFTKKLSHLLSHQKEKTITTMREKQDGARKRTTESFCLSVG